MQIAQIAPFNVAGRLIKIDRVVIHAMAEYIDLEPHDLHAVDYLRTTQLNAHAFVTPSGVVLQTAADLDLVYHARGYNNNSLGIEFLVAGVHTYHSFTRAIEKDWIGVIQYNAGVQYVRQWLDTHNLTSLHVEQHSTLSPGRKVDPGKGFPWAQFINDIT
jgi:N-acetyl-anhydromuramyl-L-alanine amidase AmpD|tara:strand:+ start:691 stop:1170 length:480 start_codon:yes stop_codon:yes gene_type:complete